MLITAQSSPEEVQTKIYRELQKGSSDSRHPFRYLSLATHNVDKEEPNIRMVILRHISEDWRIFAYTDARTAKVEELKKLNRAALLFWHSHHKTQATFKAEVILHQNDETARRYWEKDVHGSARKAYTPLVSPGTAIKSPGEAHSWPENYDSEHFCVLEFNPFDLQVLQIRKKEHKRISYQWDDHSGNWRGRWIAP